ncbi:MAG: MBOAT family protein [Bacteroidales bacterium]|nr:MBOAT family protein [Bacteroidales bacterium]
MLADLFPAVKNDTSRLVQSDTISDTSYLAASDPAPTGTESVTSTEQSLLKEVISSVFKYDPERPFIFSTSAFWIFFLIVLLGYSIVYRKLPLRNLYLFIVSLYFYYKSGGLFLILLILVTIIDFSCGLMIFRSRSRKGKRLYVFLSILSNIGLLAYFKYTEFFITTINDLFGTNIVLKDYILSFFNNILGTSYDISSILLPVGISFFTFQSLSYTFDVYRGKIEPVRNIIDFGFYVSFFPQLVAGPIVRASEFIPQVYRRFHLTKREFSHALFIISKGLIKKIVISDFIAVSFIDRVFEAPTLYSGLENLLAIYGYGLQIYCDFSGYTDIAIGLALILGFRLPVNFNSPYKANNISDFWKRWHISLSRWLKDYLYIPLGGNRKGRLRTLLNLMVTMLLGGLWHGAAARFVLWGGLHGLGLVVHKIWLNITGGRIKSTGISKFLSVFLTFNFVTLCWIFFRAPDLDSSARMFHQITGNFHPGSYISLIPAYGTVFALILAGYLIHFLPEKIKESYRGLFIRMPLALQFIIILVVAVVLFQMRGSEIMPFIYFRF